MGINKKNPICCDDCWYCGVDRPSPNAKLIYFCGYKEGWSEWKPISKNTDIEKEYPEWCELPAHRQKVMF